MKYEKPYVEIIELQATVITLVSGDGGNDGVIDWDDIKNDGEVTF